MTALATVDGILSAEDELAVEASGADLARYLETVHAYLTKYVAFPSEHEPVAVSLWIAHSWLVDRFDVSPILAVTSAEMRSGKTRVLDCCEMLCPRPWRVVQPSEAVLYAKLATRPAPTLLLDEVDTIFTTRPSERQQNIRGILNAGNQKGTPVSRVRMDGRTRELEDFDVFGAKAVAGIGDLPDTVADRSIIIRMRRRSPAERVARFRRRLARDEADAIDLPAWDSVPLVPDVPCIGEPMNDRAEDSWEPLVAVALAAGGPWPARARSAALALTGNEDDAVSLGIRLLTDIRDIFLDWDTPPYASTSDLLSALHKMEDAPWGSLKGDPLSARFLARLLRPYGIKPDHWRVGDETVRGYLRVHLEDAWQRYCTPVGAPVHGTTGTSGTDDDYPPSAWDIEGDTDR